MQSKTWIPKLIFILAPVFIVGSILLSVLYGAKEIDSKTVWEAFFHFDADNVDHTIILSSRLPRVLGALIIGAFLAISGAIMQGMTRNYLASPSIMGVSDGSTFFITFAMIFLPQLTAMEKIFFSMLGSALGAGIVFGLGSMIRNGLSPVRLAIIGTVIGTFLNSTATAMGTYFHVSQNISFWYNARLHQLDIQVLKLAVPAGVIGIILALSISKSITILSLGDSISTNLGQRTKILKVVSTLTVVLLTGTAVAIAGKIGFVGLIIPHIARFLVGMDYKWGIPCAGIIGAVFLAICDVLSRFVNYPYETPIGVVTALIGIPFFLYLIRTRGGKSYV